MKKKLIITISIVAFLAFLFFLLKGTLFISYKPSPFDIKIGQKKYSGIERLTPRLTMGPHRAIISKDFYNKISKTVWVFPLKENSLIGELKMNADGKILESRSNYIAEIWIKFTEDGDKESLIKNLKNYMTTDGLKSVSELLKASEDSNSQGITLELPAAYGPTGAVSLKATGPNSGEATIKLNKRNDDLSVNDLKIIYVRENNIWLSSNIIFED